MDIVLIAIDVLIVALIWLLFQRFNSFDKNLRKTESKIVQQVLAIPITTKKIAERIESAAATVKKEVKKSKEEKSSDGRI